MVQRYTFLHKINGNENVFVLNYIKSNNLKVLLPFYHFLVTETRRSLCREPPCLLEYIRKPMITLPAIKIREIFLIGISLPLKGYCSISLMAVSEDDKSDKPFNNIPNIKENVKHFLHLLGVYLLMIKLYTADKSVSPSEENPEEVYVTETSRGNESVLYNLHISVNSCLACNLCCHYTEYLSKYNLLPPRP